MDCRRIETLLSPLLDGEVDPDDAPAVRAHLAACPRCAARLETLRATRAAVADLRPEPSDEGWTALERRLRKLHEDGPAEAEERPRSRPRARRRRALAAALLLAALVASAAPWLLEHSGPEPSRDVASDAPEPGTGTLAPDLLDAPSGSNESNGGTEPRRSVPELGTGPADLADQPCARPEDCGANAQRLWPHFPL